MTFDEKVGKKVSVIIRKSRIFIVFFALVFLQSSLTVPIYRRFSAIVFYLPLHKS